jgi:hypothetical protein
MQMSESRAPLAVPLVLLGAALAAILIGFADLWRGGTSVAASLLVIGYVLLIPATLARAAALREPEADPPPYLFAAGVGLVIWLLYVATLAPSTAMWDTSEYITAAKVLGIPHPPGNPLFVLIAHAFALIPAPLSFAGRVNLLAATTSAISAVLWCLVAYRALRGWGLPRVPRLTISALAAWIGGTAFTVWNQSVVNEKVYTVAMLGVAAVAWTALRWDDAPEDSRRADLLLILAAYLCGLGYTNHPAGFLPLPALGLFVLIRRPKTLLRWPMLLGAAVALGVGLTPFAFQPIRTPHQPAINVGEPSACVGKPEFGCTFSALTWQRLKANIDREQYGGHKVGLRQAPITAQVGMWWLYFKWQWLRDAREQLSGLQSLLALLFLGLGITGGVLQFQRDRSSFWFVGPLIGLLTPALIVYLNFKYGASQAPELGNSVPREVRDRDYFYLWSFATWGVWAALGLGGLWQWVAGKVESVGGRPSNKGWSVAAPLLLIALIPIAGNWAWAPRTGHEFTRAWARDVLESVEPYGILVTMGDNDSFPLWYAQHVEGIRPDITLAITPYLGTDWFVRQMITRETPVFAGGALPVYDSLATAQPSGPVMRMTTAEADRIPQFQELARPQLFRQHGIDAIVPAGYLGRDQAVVLRMIVDAFPERPIYFTYPGFARDLGLQDYIVQHGLLHKLLNVRADSVPGLIPAQGGHYDFERSRALWATYEGPAALIAEQRPWVDAASANMPALYALAAEMLAQAATMRGDSATAERAQLQAGAVADISGLWR